MAITQHFDLNMIPDSEPVIVHVNQYDEGDGRFVISLWNGETAYTPAVGATATIQGMKPSGKGFDYEATLNGSTVTADLTDQMAIEAGEVRCQIVIKEGSDITGTFVFNIDVQKSALPADADMSRSDYQIVMELIETAEMINLNPPIIGQNGNWWVWSVSQAAYVDSGVDASISVTIADITMLAPDADPYVTNTGTDTDPIFHLFVPRGNGISSITKTGTSGNVDTYTITYSDSTTTTFTVTNGKSAYQYAVDGGYTGTEAQFNTDLANFTTYANQAKNSALDSEAYAIGKRNGSDVTSSDPAYHNNSKYYSSEASGSATAAATSKSDSEAYAIGKRNGSDVPSTDPTYQNNAKYYAEQAAQAQASKHIIQNAAGTTFPARSKLQFINSTIADDSTNDRTVITGSSGILPYLYIESESGAAVTVTAPDSSTITPTVVSSGHWKCELPSYGTYVVTASLSGVTKTKNVVVDTVKEYSVFVNLYDFTINVTADAGSTIRVEAGTEVYTATATGSSQAFEVGQASTQYTVTETLDGHTDSQTVTSSASTGQSTSVSLSVYITVTVTLYGAIEDTISYTDATGAKIQQFASGQTSKSGVNIKVYKDASHSITFTSAVAKDLSNLSNDYSKTVTITSGTSEIYVMPEGAVYWYGWSIGEFAAYAYKASGSGASATAPTLAKSPQYYSASQTAHSSGGTQKSGIVAFSVPVTGYTKIKTYGKVSSSIRGTAMMIASLANSYTELSTAGTDLTTSYSIGDRTISASSEGYIATVVNSSTSGTVSVEHKAIWLE